MRRSRRSVSRREVSGAVAGAVLFSGLITILGFIGPLFMLVVYDRVIPSGSLPSLVALLILAAGPLCLLGLPRRRTGPRAFESGWHSRSLAFEARACSDRRRAVEDTGQWRRAETGTGKWIRSAPSSAEQGPLPCSICRGCRSTWPSASSCIRSLGGWRTRRCSSSLA